MKKYASVLDDVVCLEEIKKIKILYHNDTNYSNKYLHSLFVTYKDGTKEEYSTDDYSKAKQDYENLKSLLLKIDTDHQIEKGRIENKNNNRNT